MKGMSLLNEVDYEITNVYRTENYIVCQTVHICYGDNGNILISEDIFHRRTPERDAKFEKTFGVDTPFNKRKRMKVAAYTRQYID